MNHKCGIKVNELQNKVAVVTPLGEKTREFGKDDIDQKIQEAGKGPRKISTSILEIMALFILPLSYILFTITYFLIYAYF